MHSSNPQPSENLRQLEHLIPIAFAFLLRYLTWHQSLLLAFLAIVYGALSSRIWKVTRRQGEGVYSPGKVAYGIAVFVLILLFPGKNFIVVATWANLSVGDAVSNLVGRRFGQTVLPWNRAKTWAGMAAAFAASTLAAWVLILWTGFPDGAPGTPGLALWYAAATSLVCSTVETLPVPVDDNLTICAAGGAFLSWLSGATLPAAWQPNALIVALVIAAVFGLAALFLRAVSIGGFAAGTLIGTTVYYSLGARGFVLLGLFFVLGTAFSRFGYSEKKQLGVAQANHARRSGKHVWGKGFAAFAAALAGIFTPFQALAAVAFVTAVAASLSDTTATELGQLYGKRPFLLTDFRRVPRGTPGAVSFAGSIFGLAAAGLITGTAYLMGMTSLRGMAWGLAAATLATHVEGYLAARPAPVKASGPMLNAFHTTLAMLLALLLARFGT
jgi:uncharacterized protein (TIGR00297 family)